MKKIAVLLPVFILALLFLKVEWRLRDKGSVAFGVCIMLLVMAIGVYKRKQETFLQAFIQSTFLIYVFMVLTLTGYFILFREVAAHGWWQKVLHRIQTKEKINLQPFLMFKQFQIASTQVIGNLVMLLPLGIYVPLLFPKLAAFFRVFLFCLLISISIELMQLITYVRSTDIDDVILNTSGAVVGYIIYRFLSLLIAT
jgi:glycopeptide antibiotics resistance protein